CGDRHAAQGNKTQRQRPAVPTAAAVAPRNQRDEQRQQCERTESQRAHRDRNAEQDRTAASRAVPGEEYVRAASALCRESNLRRLALWRKQAAVRRIELDDIAATDAVVQADGIAAAHGRASAERTGRTMRQRDIGDLRI